MQRGIVDAAFVALIPLVASWIPPDDVRQVNPTIRFERYADDFVCHCRTERQAYHLKGAP